MTVTTTTLATPEPDDNPDGGAQSTVRVGDGLLLMTCPQAANALGLSVSRLRQLRNAGRGPASVVLGERTVRYRPADVEDYRRSRASVTDGLISTPQLSAALGITRSTITAWAKNGTLPPPVKTVNRLKYYDLEDVKRVLAGLVAGGE